MKLMKTIYSQKIEKDFNLYSIEIYNKEIKKNKLIFRLE